MAGREQQPISGRWRVGIGEITMKALGSAIIALCVLSGAASATTLPPYHQKATPVAVMPAPPAPDVTSSERDYFLTPDAKVTAAQHVSCRTPIAPVSTGALTQLVECN
jgi:hypothetical protein